MDGLWDEDGGVKPGWEVLLVGTPAGLLARATDWLETLPKGLDRQGVVLCESSALRERLRVHVARRLRRPGLLFGVELWAPGVYARRLLLARGAPTPPSGAGESALRLRLGAALREADPLAYFDASQLAREPGFIEAFARTFQELAEGGFTPDKLDEAAQRLPQDLDAARVRDVAQLWRRVGPGRGATRAGLLEQAAKLGGAGVEGPTLAILTQAPDAALARFIKSLPQAHVLYFGARPERAATARRKRLLALPDLLAPSLLRPKATDLERLKARLFDPAAPPCAPPGEPDGSVELEEHAGFEEEIEAAACWAVEQARQGTPLPRIALWLTRPDAQLAPLLDRLSRIDPPLPAFVPAGRPRRETSAGVRVLGILEALQRGLAAEHLARILPWLKVPEAEQKAKPLSASRCAKLVYSAGILGGTPDDLAGGLAWHARLQARRKEYSAALQRDPKTVPVGARLEARRWVDDMVPRLPAIEALEALLRGLAHGASLEEFAPKLAAFLEAWLALPLEAARFLPKVRAELEGLAQDPTCAGLQGVEALGALRGSLAHAKVPWGRPGRGVFVGTPREAAGVEFDCARVVGFVEGVFPRVPMDDPILPSDLRARLEAALPPAEGAAVALRTLEDELAEDLQGLWRALAGVKRRVAFSACRQWADRTDRALSSAILDVVEALGPGLAAMRAQGAGSFVGHLRASRLRPGAARLAAQSQALMLTPKSAFGAWRASLTRDGKLPEAWAAPPSGELASLWTDTPTWEEPPPSAQDAPKVPGLEPARPLSPSWLAKVLRCPYQFLQERVLFRAPPVERPETDRLSVPALSGLLRDLTETLFQKRGRWICAQEGSLEEHLSFARGELFQAFVKLRQVYPLRGGDTEAAELERAWRHVESLLFYEWGLERREFVLARQGYEAAALRPSPDAEPLYLRGQLDRADRVAGGGYALRSLRLGRGRGLKEEEPNPERDLALGLQVLVAEQDILKGGEVVEATLVFLTAEGAQERAFRGDDLEGLREKTRQWLGLAAALLRGGHFARTPLASDCASCPFAQVCGEDSAVHSAAALKQAPEPWLRDLLALKEAMDVG